MRTIEETFGITGPQLAAGDLSNPTTPNPTIATTRVQNEPPSNPVRALIDPQGSAIFWVGLAALLGLIMVTGQFKIQAAVGGRAGRKR